MNTPTESQTATPEDAWDSDSAFSGHNRPILPAAEALERLSRGEPLCDVYVADLRLRGEFAEPIVMERVTLVRCEITKATFTGPVRMTGSNLNGLRIRKRVTFCQGLDLRGSVLKRPSLVNVTVTGPLRLDNARLQGKATMLNCTLADEVRLWDAGLEGWVEFRDCTFRGLADFRSLRADQGISLLRCRFEADVLLRGASVAKKLDFGTSRLEGLLDLSKAKLHDFVYLERIEQGPGQRFAFANALADRILTNRGQLAGRLASECAGEVDVAQQEYGLLKRNFQTLHRYDDEDWAFYRYKVNNRRARPQSWWRPWTKLQRLADYVFLDLGCGYGTNPFRAVVSAGVLILVFAMIYMSSIHSFSIEAPPLNDQPIDSIGNRALFGLLTSVSVFTAGFTAEHVTRTHGWMLMPLALEALIGTLLWGLFIVAFSRKVIR